MELAEEGVRKPKDMKIHINEFLKHEIFPGEELPAKHNRRFFPTNADFRAHINRVIVKNRFSKIDQENIEELVNRWQASNLEDKYYFRKFDHGLLYNFYNI